MEHHGQLLRLALRIDAIVSAAFGLLVLLGSLILPDLLGPPSRVFWVIGGVVLVYAAGLWSVQSRALISAAAGWSVVALNLVWAVASVGTVVLGWLPLTGLGIAFVLLQAAVVAGLADLQFVGVRRATAWRGLAPGQ
ncbi:MAG TPA: hypothetical protein VGL99_05740 [Chloroflexota bacterium]|jgi:hypothetical protein